MYGGHKLNGFIHFGLYQKRDIKNGIKYTPHIASISFNVRFVYSIHN